MKKISLVLLLILFTSVFGCIHDNVKPTPADNSVITNKEEAKAVSLFQDRQIIPQEVIDPSGLPECILIQEKQGDNCFYYWTKLISTRPDPKPEFKNELIYESIVDKSFATKANYLTVTGSLGAEDKVELIIEEVFTSKGAPFSDPAIMAAAESFINKDPKKKSRTYFYIQNIKYTTIKYKIFKKVEGAAGFTGVGFGAEGKVFASNSNYSLQKIISINTFPLDTDTIEKGDKLPLDTDTIKKGAKLPLVLNNLNKL
jgi:hypothetical protein